MKPAIKREIRIFMFILIFGLILYADSTSVKSWRYPLELSPENKEIEYRAALFIIYLGYLSAAAVRLLIHLIKKFSRRLRGS